MNQRGRTGGIAGLMSAFVIILFPTLADAGVFQIVRDPDVNLTATPLNDTSIHLAWVNTIPESPNQTFNIYISEVG